MLAEIKEYIALQKAKGLLPVNNGNENKSVNRNKVSRNLKGIERTPYPTKPEPALPAFGNWFVCTDAYGDTELRSSEDRYILEIDSERRKPCLKNVVWFETREEAQAFFEVRDTQVRKQISELMRKFETERMELVNRLA